MNFPQDRLDAVLREIERANAEDPRRIVHEGAERPYESIYALRMAARLAQLYPGASELLQIAARAQHIRRWEIPRSRYPEGRAGYETWRRACRAHHVTVVSAILARQGYEAAEIAHVAKLIRKDELKTNGESQALENVVCAVFVEHYIDEFLAKYGKLEKAKLINILAKTLRKMSAEGHGAVLGLPLKPEIRALIDAALERERAARSSASHER